MGQQNEPGGDGTVEVQFPLEVVDGWPPVPIEPVWARPLDDGRMQLLNVPFFAVDAARLDIVQVKRDEVGGWRFVAVVAPSGHSVARVIAAEVAALPSIIEAMVGLGCAYEPSFIDTLVAFDVPPDADFGAITRYLRAAEDAARLDYDEGAVAAEHAAQAAGGTVH